MKSIKILLASLALALFVAGCAGSSGMSNLDHTEDGVYFNNPEGDDIM